MWHPSSSLREMIATWLVGGGVIFVALVLALRLGSVSLLPARTITVYGTAYSDEQNNIAVYNAGVTATDADKDTAVNQVNQEVEKLIQSLKDFGIAEADLQTQSVSVYKLEEPIFRESGTPSQGESVWQANNSIEVRLRDATRASDLTTLLTQSGATNVYGPSFQVDTTQNPEDALTADAIENAREKAQMIAAASGDSLGKVLSVTEGSSGAGVYPVAFDRAMSGGGGAPIEPGTSLLSKTVTVTFKINRFSNPFE